ncbi:MAG: exodeoxyribonuclease VII small subunit [Desulfobacteraceae bacterium]|jgi:exodeoxyribonuclease VII small subunit
MPKQSFEKALEQLENIVETLESNELSLEKALAKFEEGMKLSRFCAKKLDETERKISLIMETTNGEVKEAPFEEGDDSGS